MTNGRRIRMVGLGTAGLWLVAGLGVAAASADDMAPQMAPVSASMAVPETATMADTAPMQASAPPAAAPDTGAMSAPAFSAGVVEGLRHLYARDYGNAVNSFAAAAEADPQDPAARYYLGYAYYRMGDFGQARTAFAEAYRIDPHFSPEPKAP
jgi:Flp pilus assembly protein TadD